MPIAPFSSLTKLQNPHNSRSGLVRMSAPSLPQITTDYQVLREGAGIVDLWPRTQLELTGQDRQTFLQGFCTNNVKQLQPGSGCEAFLTNLQGKTLGSRLSQSDGRRRTRGKRRGSHGPSIKKTFIQISLELQKASLNPSSSNFYIFPLPELKA